MNNNTSNDGNLLSSEECNRLRELMDMAYPHPKSNMRAKVMAQIEADARKQKRINRFLRYGSVAACLIFAIGAITAIAPLLTDRFDNAAMEKAYYAEVNDTEMRAMVYTADVELTEAEGTQAPELLMSTSLPAEDANASDATLADSTTKVTGAGTAQTEATVAEEPQAETVTELLTAILNDAPAVEYATTSPYDPQADAAEADTIFYAVDKRTCTEHDADMHRFDEELIVCVGTDAFAVWYENEEAAEECGIPSVDRMVRHFAMDRDTFAEITAQSDTDYNLNRIFPEN